jgi:hypothetical protein
MAGLGDELRRLRKRLEEAPRYSVPVEVRAHMTHLERCQALEAFLEPPDYKEDELQHLYREDLFDAAGEGTIAHYRDAAGWQTEEARNTLDLWQNQAKQRVGLVEELGEDWRDVYNHDVGAGSLEEEEGPSIFDLLENEQDERKTND